MGEGTRSAPSASELNRRSVAPGSAEHPAMSGPGRKGAELRTTQNGGTVRAPPESRSALRLDLLAGQRAYVCTVAESSSIRSCRAGYAGKGLRCSGLGTMSGRDDAR